MEPLDDYIRKSRKVRIMYCTSIYVHMATLCILYWKLAKKITYRIV